MSRTRKTGAVLGSFAVLTAVVVSTTVISDPVAATHPDLTVEILTAPNFVVDSNIEAPSSYGPYAGHVAAQVCNTGSSTLTDVLVMSGDFDPDGNGDFTDSTAGMYPERTHTGLTGTFSLTHEGGTTDATRYLPELAPGECTTQYYLISYPTLDDNGDSVTGGNSQDDDLWLELDMWATATHPVDGAIYEDSSTVVTMRSEISAMANKVWPNTTSKVPDEYLSAFETQLGWRPELESFAAGSSGALEGIWYDLGRVNQGFDANGDFVPDYDLWMQPVGDSALYDPSCTRLVRTYGVVIVTLNDGTEQVIAFEDTLYFSDIPENNTGVVGLVFYEFVTLDGGCSSTLTPYQEVASGSNNEKFNGDYGTFAGSISASEPELSLDKSGPALVSPGGTATFDITATNTSTTNSFGLPEYGTPLVLSDSIPAGVEYVPGSAEINNTLPSGIGVSAVYSTDNGASWTATEPAAADVTDVAFYLDATLPPGETVTVTFDVSVPVDYSEAIINNTASASVGSGEPFTSADHTILLAGTNQLSGTVFADDGGTTGTIADGLQDGDEGGVPTMPVSLYIDADGDGTFSDGDLFVGSTDTAADGTYSFTSLPDGSYVVVVDQTDPDKPTGWGMTTEDETLVVIAGVDVADIDFGFSPAIDIAKDLIGSSPVAEGDEISYTLGVSNVLAAADAGSGPTSCDPICEFWADNLNPDFPSTFTGAANSLGEADGAYATTTWGSDNYLDVLGYNDPTGLGNITKVEAVFNVELTGALLNDDRVDVRVWDVSGGAYSQITSWALSAADLNPYFNAGGELVFDITGNWAWDWADFRADSPNFDLTANKSGGGDGSTVGFDAIGFRITTDYVGSSPGGTFDEDTTVSTVPLTDTYDPARFRFVSASIPPSNVDEVTGTITWDNVGPLNAGATQNVVVTFEVLEPTGNATEDVDNNISVIGAMFASGLPANDDSDIATVTVDPRGLISGTIWSEATGGTTGWVGTTGYEDGTDLYVANTTVNLYACRDGAFNLYPASNTGNSCTSGGGQGNGGTWVLVDTVATDANGYYEFVGLDNGYYYVEVDETTIPGTVTATGDPDVTPGTCGASCDNLWSDPALDLIDLLTISTANDIPDGNFGYEVPPAIYGALWNDVDGDGVQDIGEGPLVGWTVEIYDGATLVGTATTDADGNYLFADLTSGTAYTVSYVAPGGETWTETFETDATVDNAISVTPVAGEVSGSWDFALQQTGTATIGDAIYYDVDGDGVQGANDEGLPGVTVELYLDANGDGILDLASDAYVASAVTDAGGLYSFDQLPAGTYFVVVDGADPALLTANPTGDPDETGGACTTCDEQSDAVTVADGATNDGQDFGYQPTGTGSIGDTVWLDSNGDGVVDASESGLANVTVTLLADLNGDGVYVTYATTVTDADGVYNFDNLPDGDYRIEVDTADTDLPTDGFGQPTAPSTVSSYDVAVVAGSTTDTADFGFTTLGAIGDTVFADANANGTQDWNESGVDGVTVELWSDLDGDGTYTLETTTVTDADGLYSFSGLQPGDYQVVVDESTLPWTTATQTADPDRDGVACADNAYPSLPGCDGMETDITVNLGTTYMGADFGYQPPGAVGDFVWLDGNGDGTQDAGEPGLFDVTVNLYSDPDGDGIGDTLLATTTTDFDGFYSFSDLADGDYVIEVDNATLPYTMVATTGPESAGADTAAVEIISGASNLDIDFGYQLTGTSSLSGTVCLEPTGGTNGTCDDPTNETELDGITVNLYDSTGTYLGSTTTDVNGDYTFTDLPDGDYVVSIATNVFPLSISDITDAGITETASSVYQSVTLTGTATNIDFPFEQVDDVDLGDLDTPFDSSFGSGPYNIIGDIYLGAGVDADTQTLANADATGDDLDGTDDEDGVTFNAATWAPDALDDGDDGSVTVTVGGGDGYLVAWIDWNQDGALTGPDEMIVNQSVVAGTTTFTFDIPDGTDLNNTFDARFRLFDSAPPLPSISYTGAYTNGEIEDYVIELPRIAATKALTGGPTLNVDGTADFTYQITVSNTGTATLFDVDATDSLSTFGSYSASLPLSAGSYTVSAPVIASSTPDPLADPVTTSTSFDGQTNTSLLNVGAGGSLASGESVVIEFTVTAAPDHASTCTTGCLFSNTATATGDQTADGTSDGETTSTSTPVEVALGSISGSVTEDTDFNGTGDAAISGVTIELYADVDGDGSYTDLIATTTTDASGNYHFGNVAPDEYRIVETQPATYTSVSDSDGNNDDIIPVIASPGAESTGNDFVEQLAGDPVLQVVKSGPASAAVGDTVTYTFDVSHDPALTDGSPAIDVTVTDDVAGTATYTSGDTNTNNQLDDGETWTYTATHTVSSDDPAALVNTATADSTDLLGNATPTVTDNHTTSVDFAPVLNVAKSGPATAAVDDTVTYTFDVSHDATSDGSPVSTVSVNDDLAGAATYVSGDDGDNLLEAGETWQFSANYTISPDDPNALVNTVTVSGTDGDGQAISPAIDDHTTNVEFSPVLVVEKSGPATAAVGQEVTYTFTVSHDATSDNSPVSSVTITDDVAGTATFVSGDDGDNLLESGETWNYQVTYTIASGDPTPLVNTVTAAGTDADGDALVTVFDTHSTDVDYNPVLEVLKSGPATATVGETITYTFDLSHDATSDNSPVSAVVVTDDVAGAATYVSGDTDLDDQLDPGETWSYTVDYTVAPGDPDALFNTVTVDGSTVGAVPVSATDSHTTNVEFAPELNVVKNGPAIVTVGETVTYTFEVSHTVGSDLSPVSGITVIDNLASGEAYVSGDTDGDNLLDGDETWTFAATYTVQASDTTPLNNTVTVDGNDLDSDPVATVTDTHSASIDYAPILSIVKNGPATAAIGDTVTYTFDVSHDATSDNSPISGVAVTDDIAGVATYDSGDDGDNLLEAGETWTFTATYTVDTADVDADPTTLTNTATAAGTDGDGQSVPGVAAAPATDTHVATITYNPVLNVIKSGPVSAAVGDTVTYTFDVAHDATSDDTPVSGVTVTDDVAGATTYVSGDTNTNSQLDPGETWQFTVDYTIVVTDADPLVNTASASGTDVSGEIVTGTDVHSTDIDFAPTIAVVKTAVANAAVGDIVTYSFDVTQAPDSDGSPVSNITIADDVAGTPTYASGDDGDNLLEAGETWTYTATYAVQPTDPDPLVNTVTVNGNDADGEALTQASDNHSLDVSYAPLLNVTKSGAATANVGDTVTYTFDVTHDAASDLSPISAVSVNDDVAGVATYMSGDVDTDDLLESGETWTYTATYTVAASDSDPLVNIVTVAGTDNDGEVVPDATDTHSTDIEFAPELEVVKSGPATVGVGDIANYSFDVSHSVDSDGSAVSGVTVVDDVAGAATYDSGDTNTNNLLDNGETWTYTVSYTVTLADADPLVNTVTVGGTDNDGDPLTSATDTHSADIVYEPILTVTKTGPATATVGQTVTYSFAVSHDPTSDQSPVSAVTVTDDVAGTANYASGDTNTDNVLQSGETWTYTVTYTVQAADPDPLDNTVTVDGTTLDGTSATDATDTHSADIDFAPTVEIVKSGPTTAAFGDTLTYTFDVSHAVDSDGSAMSAVSVTDDVAGTATYTSGDINTNNLLDNGETWTYTATYTIDATTPDPVTNTATVVATDRDGEAVPTDTDTHTTAVTYAPTLDIVKSGPVTASTGVAATYTFDVSHGTDSDGSPIANVAVTDDVAGAATYDSGDTNTNNLLDNGETWTYTATYTPTGSVSDPLLNTGTATGDDLDGAALTPVTDSHATDIDFQPVLTTTKTGPATAIVGETVTYTFTVAHDAASDGSAVSGVTVVDDVAGTASLISGDDGDNLLEAGETWTYTATYTVAVTDPEPLVNTVSVDGTDRDGDALTTSTATHSTDIDFKPVLAATKTGPATAAAGDTITYTIEVTQDPASDESPIDTIVVNDSILGTLTLTSGDDGDDILESGETWIYTVNYTVQADDPDPLINVVTVNGNDRDGEALTSATATHITDVTYDPVLSVTKSGPVSATVGETVTYTFTVEHGPTSDGSPMTVQSVTDDIAGAGSYTSGDTNGNGLVDSGETWTYTATRTVTQFDAEPINNTVTVTISDLEGETQTDTDSHSMAIDYAPVLSVVKTGVALAAVDQTVTYSFAVSHDPTSDGSPVTSVSVSDDVAGTVSYVSGDDGDNALEGGETWTYQATYTVTAGDPSPLTNTVTVTGADLDSTAVTATDSHDTTVDYAPVLAITKTGPASAAVGDVVTYSFDLFHAADSDGSAISSLSVNDDIAGAATYLSGDDGDSLLEVSETWTYTVTYTVQASDPDPLNNTATANGLDGNLDPISAQDGHSLDVSYAPVLTATKSGPATATVGQVATYTVDVGHDATSDGSAVALLTASDDVVGSMAYVSGDTDGDSLLDGGETWQFSGTYTIDSTDTDPLTNTATATGVDGDGQPVTISDQHDTDVVYEPDLLITKTGPASAAYGDTATYTFTVRHSATSDLSPVDSVSVTDDVAGAATYVSGDDGDAVLEAGETWTYTVDYALSGDLADPLVNTGTLSATDGDGDTITASSQHSTNLTFDPVISVVKTGPATAEVGENVTYSFDVSHDVTSDGSPISDISITDDIAGTPTRAAGPAGGDTDSDDRLDAGETWTYTATYTIQATDPDPLTNTVSVSGTDGDGTSLLPAATDNHSTDINFTPELEVVKSGPATATVGETVTYSFAVSHTPTSDGSSVGSITVVDDIAGPAFYVNGDDGDNRLEAGETWTYTATYTVDPEDPDPLTNTVTVDGLDRDGDATTTATDNHSTNIVFEPEVQVVKSGPATAVVGETVTYTFELSHTVGSDLSPVTVSSVTDDVAGTATRTGGDTDADNFLDGGETWTYSATHTVTLSDPDPLDNTVTVTATDGDGEALTTAPTDSHSTDIDFQPVLTATKSGPAAAVVGETVTYTFTVAHDPTSDGSPVTSVSLSDDVAGATTRTGGDTNGDDILQNGETWTFEVTYTIAPDDPDGLTNTATIDGTDADGEPATSNSPSHTTNIEFTPALTVDKTGPATATVGDTVTYTFTVTHDALTSDLSPISGVTVIDDVAGTATYDSGDDGDNLLESGETWTYTATHDIAVTDNDPLVNTVLVDGTDGDGDPVAQASDTHSTDIDLAPVALVTKSGPATAAVGDTVTYTFTVSHDPASDGSPISSVAVVDDVAGTATYDSGDDGDDLLELGETWNYTVNYTIQPSDVDPLINTVSIDGVDADGEAITTDTADHSTALAYNPVLDVTKSGPAQVAVGDTVSYTIDVTHGATSDLSPISGLTVTDDVFGTATYDSGDDGDNLLEAGETWTFTGTYTVTLSDPDPLVNTATANGTDGDGETISGSDSHSADVDYEPLLDVVKSGPATATIGQIVTYNFNVTHDAVSDQSPVANVSVVDDVAGTATYTSGDDGDNLLESGETWIYTATHLVTVDDADPLVNVVTVDGDDLDGTALTSTTDSHSTAIDQAAVLEVVKNGPATAVDGETVTYTFNVSHDATSDGSEVADVTVTDDIAGAAAFVSGDDDGDDLLDNSETWIYTVDYLVRVVDADPLINTATASATDGDAETITSTDTHSLDVVRSAIEVVKDGPTTAAVGDTVTFTFDVSHTVDSDGSAITDIAVTDNVAGATTYLSGDDNGNDALDGAEVWRFTVDYVIAPTDSDPLINTATANGTDLAARTLVATDTHSTAIDYAPVLNVVKNGPAAAADGDTVTYTFDVSHDVTSDDSPVSSITVVDDVAGTATYDSGDDGDGLLEAGETWIYTVTYVVQDTDPDPLTNTVTVTANDGDGETVTATDSHDTDVVRGGLLVDKTTTTPYLLDGETAQFQITASNVGDSDLTNVVITDALAPGCDATFTTLIIGASETVTCEITNVTGDLTNSVAVTAEDSLGNEITGTDSVDVTVIDPAITVDLTPESQSVVETGTATFTVTVTNTGDSTLTDVTLTSPAVPGCDTVVASLTPGESHTYTCTLTDVTSDITNAIAAVGTDLSGDPVSASDSGDVNVLVPAVDIQKTPDIQQVLGNGTATFTITITNAGATELTDIAVSDPLASSCDATYATLAIGASETYTCSVSPVTADFTNTASVTADDPLGNPHTDSDVADVDVIAPALSISKTPDTQNITLNGTADFTIQVVNSGDVTITGLTITDPLAPACDTTTASLAPGESTTINCTSPTVSADFTNTATVTGTDPLGGSVTNSDTADVVTLTPSISITKDPAIQDVAYGDSATFTITVSNDGETPLTNIAVVDPLTASCDTTIASLNPTESSTYSCTATDIVAGFTNTATVTADDPIGNETTDSASADVTQTAAAISIDKTPDTQTVASGDPSTFTITVTNTSAVELTGVTVTDAAAPGCDATFATLAAGASETVTCSVAGTTAAYTNTANVTADDPYGTEHTATDEAIVAVINPALSITKTTATPQIHNGDDVTFTIEVANTGDVPISNVAVTDPAAPGCDAIFATLAAGETQSYSCTASAVVSDLVNVATVTADDPLGNELTAIDSQAVDVLNPAITVSATPSSQAIVQGDDATVDITVTNSGDATLSDVTVGLPSGLDCGTMPSATLEPGESVTYTCTYSAVTTDIVADTITATGTDDLGLDVTDSTTVDVSVLVPAVEIQKSPDFQLAPVGSTAEFTITVTNSGQTALTDIEVSDARVPNCDTSIASLAIGESTSVTCTADITDALASDFTNTASVTAVDPIGTTHSDSDVADVDVISPALTVTKSPDGQAVIYNDTATFAIEVANTGDVTLTNIVVSDPLAPACDTTIASLDPSTSQSYTCTVDSVTADFTNAVSVIADEPSGGTVSTDDTADVTVLNPELTIDKTPVEPVIVQGETAEFTITVTNSGETDLTTIVITDPTLPACDSTIASLAVGETVTYTCTSDAAFTDVTNTITAVADDPLSNSWTASDSTTVTVTDGGGVDGHLFLDLDADGIQDPDEPNLADVDVIITALDGTVITVTSDSNGDWLAPIVPAGIATIEVDTGDPDFPSGFGVSTNNGSQDVAVDSSTGGTLELTSSNPVGFAPLPAISGTAWVDTDGDNTFTDADDILPGATVELLDENGDVVDTTTTDDAGRYQFDELTPGEYTVRYSPPPNNDYSEVTPTEITVEVGLADDVEVDAGFELPALIDGVVWSDDNGDGTRDGGERGVDGIIVTLTGAGDDGVLGTSDDVAVTTTTASDGTYSFDGLIPGDYDVTIDVDSDVVTAGDHNHQVTLVSGEQAGPLQTGVTVLAGVEGVHWIDIDKDGQIGENEPRLAGVTIEVTASNGSAALTATSPTGDGAEPDGSELDGSPFAGSLAVAQDYTLVTDEQGRYSQTDLVPGTYLVQVTANRPSEISPRVETDGSIDEMAMLTIPPQTIGRHDIGYEGKSAFEQIVWLDFNGDKVIGDNEPRLDGVDVDVTWAGFDGEFGTADDWTTTVTTGACVGCEPGEVKLDCIPAGPYRLDIVDATVSDDYALSVDPDQELDGIVAITLTNNETTSGIDMGYGGTATLGDEVWFDADGDGVRDDDEQVLAGVDVIITWLGPDGLPGGGDDQTITVTTDDNGVYRAPNLPPGIYTVVLSPDDAPDGYSNDTIQVELLPGTTNLDGDIPIPGDSALNETPDGPLAYTGAESGDLVAAGLALLALGVGLLLLARRRRDNAEIDTV